MRLNEISLRHSKHLARTPWSNKRAVVDWLIDHHFKPDAGAFSTVWTDDSNIVVKLTRDPSFPKYVDFCRQHRGNPHLPRISRIFPVADYGVIAFLERLTPSTLNLSAVYEMDEYLAWQRVRQQDNEWEVPASIEQFAKRQPELAKTLDLIAAAFSGAAFMHDIHPANIMMRGSTVVLVDPIKPM